MAYTKAELVAQVLNSVNGGSSTQDSKVKREDIAHLIPAAINFVLTEQYWLNARDGDRSFAGDFIATYPNVEIKYDDDRDLRYITLPERTVALPKDMGISAISPMRGDMSFARTTAAGGAHNSYYSKHVPGTAFWWREGQKVFFRNIPDIMTKVLVRVISSGDQVNDDDPLPIPAGMEMKVVQVLREFFVGQRQLPEDMINNNADG